MPYLKADEKEMLYSSFRPLYLCAFASNNVLASSETQGHEVTGNKQRGIFPTRHSFIHTLIMLPSSV